MIIKLDVNEIRIKAGELVDAILLLGIEKSTEQFCEYDIRTLKAVIKKYEEKFPWHGQRED